MPQGIPDEIWSGAQTGADQGGLEAAELLGIKTGGWVTRHCRTEDGHRPYLIERFGLKETGTYNYTQRTKYNAEQTSATLWIGRITSSGWFTTRKALVYFPGGKPYFILPYTAGLTKASNLVKLYDWFREERPAILNVAGNRESKNPGIQKFTKLTLVSIITELRE